ncbi:tRNA dimethylallyltransferase 2-like isoform X2 [Mercurialis annua]|uniref:tRNA dimethylallyltransferase 2-like isoform X2 n=1 Tax=Mercurialis annua TaxID=3986 RepID=UPI0024AF371A|nr:tRNA dimethylallyltransferase 2-like isoform X2 [Mercurialis annua]
MKKKGKVVVIMGPTGSGNSKLAIDLATHRPNIEITNADSMQVYDGLDVLTNKVPLHEQKGILSRDCLPVIVGGTNYYIQALVSPFLLDDIAEDFNESFQNEPPSGDEQNDEGSEFQRNGFNSYDYLKHLDPVAANRLHPNNHRRINQYLSLHARCGILPSKLYQEKASEAKEEEIERKKTEVKDRVQAQLGRAEEATKRLAEIREELEDLSDPLRKEVSMVRKKIDILNRELKPLGFTCHKKLVSESERLRMKKLEELSKNIETLN